MPPKQRQALTDRSNMSLAVEPATVNPARLKYDYSQIDEAHRERVQFATIAIQDYMSRAAESVIRAGQELIEVKEVLPHGQFGEWLEIEFGMSHRTANNWMNVAKTYGGKFATVANLNASALILLAAPSTPEAARQEVETTARETGTPPTRKEVQAVIRKHKPPEPKPARVVYTDPQPPSEDSPLPQDLAEEGWEWYSHKGAFNRLVHHGKRLATMPFTGTRTPEQLHSEIRRLNATDAGKLYGDIFGVESTSESAALPDGYTLRQTPRGWRWRRELTEGTVLMGDYCETEAGAAESAHRDWEARQARLAARTVYVEPQTEPTAEPEPSERPREYTIALDAEAYAALRTAVRHGALAMRMRGEVKERIKAAIEKAQHED